MTTKSTEKSQKTAKTVRPGVHFDKITEAVNAHADDRFACLEQKAFMKLTAPGGQVVYFAWGKPDCRRVDLSFVPPEELGLSSVVPIRAPNGAIQRELDTSSPAFLDDLATLLGWLKDAPPVVKEKRRAFVPALPVIAQRAPLSKEDRAAKRAKLEEVARQHGVGVSASAIAALGDGESSDEEVVDEERDLGPDLSDISDEAWEAAADALGE